MSPVSILTDVFSADTLLAEFRARVGDVGALASFTGYCRADAFDGDIAALELEHYPDFSAKIIAAQCARIAERCKAPHWRVAHRVGIIAPGEAIVFVATASAHRAESFLAVERMMDWLKTDAPLWKREHLKDGRRRWIEPTLADRERRERAL